MQAASIRYLGQGCNESVPSRDSRGWEAVTHVDVDIRTVAGVVRGRWESGVAVFRGIPYAEPPFGLRRFAAPVPVMPWGGVREAITFGPPVPQAGHSGAVMSSVSGTAADGSGDCLTLNVWSPVLGAAGLPVLVWIHGGRYLQGSSANPHHDGAMLAARGVVVVSMNYRVGAEGFAHIHGAPDNRGILDQVAALRSVQDNIAAFGGEPNTVTVFGQSAGAGSVAALLAMPMATGLFRRAIAQSVPGTFFSPDLASAVSEAIAAELGARPDAHELARISPHALIEATESVLQKMPEFVKAWGPMALTPTPFSPIVDGEIIVEVPWRALATGAARDIELLVGHTRDEYSLFNPYRGVEMPEEQVSARLDQLAPAIRGDAYRTEYPDANASQRYEILNSDWLFRMPTLQLADAQHSGGGRAWMYELCWSFNRDEGASHSLDLLLVFGTLSIEDVRIHASALPNTAEELRRVSDRMRNDWVRFATSGDPGWPRYHPDTRTTRVYASELLTGPYPEEGSRRIWREHDFGILDLPGHSPRQGTADKKPSA